MTVKLASSGAGHGGAKTNNKWRDSGALSADKKRTEADVSRTINSKLLKLVKAVDTTDNAGTSVNDNLYYISRNINSAPDGVALSHHLNAFNGYATGVEVLYGSSADKPLASKLSATIAKALGIVDRGAKDGSWLAIARNTKENKRVLLIEWCFIDNPSDLAKLDKNMDKAIEAVAKIFGYNPSADKPKPSTPSKPTPSKPQAKIPKGFTAEKAKFTVTVSDGIQVRKGSHGLNAPKAGILKKGQSINYDSWASKDGYIWVHYTGNSGDQLFLPVRQVGKSAWGTFK